MLFYFVVIFTIIIIGSIVVIGGCAIHSIIQEYRRDRVPALLYHHFTDQGAVSEVNQDKYHPVYFCYDTAFEQQMSYLRSAGYTAISLDDFIDFQDGKKGLPPKPIIITFDDGFMSNYLYAFPILRKYGMTATIFVTVDPNSPNFKKYADVDLPLTAEQLKEMSAYGISIESHSMSHRYLSELTPEMIRWELQESKSCLEKTLQKSVRFIAIPSGAYDRTVKQLVKETEYSAAFCMLKGSNNKTTDRFALRRLVIGRDYTLEDFERTLRPATACYLRLASSLQNALLFMLGPGGLDSLRDSLYQSALGRSVIRGQVRYLVPVALIVLLFGGFMIVSYWRS
jgi:peptidoglycan/xylan/chitin deacetylase (PgdA/CDA1 family)